jgi:hypothetical protein
VQLEGERLLFFQRSASGNASDRVIIPRRAFLKGLVGLIAAPAIVKAEILMPIQSLGTDQVAEGPLQLGHHRLQRSRTPRR